MIVRIPDDIYSYDNKVWGNFTLRQIVCMGIALIVVIPIFILLFWSTGSIDLAAVISFFVAVPILMCATFKRDGQHLEKIIRYKLQARFKYPQKRKYVMTNLYEEILKNQKEYEAYHEKVGDCNKTEKTNKLNQVIKFMVKKEQHTR
jgi:hypothetical protein